MSSSERVSLRFHPEAGFGGFSDIDGTLRFYARVQQLLTPDAIAIDVGCGRGVQGEDPVQLRRELRILRGRCLRVIGIDIDQGAAVNPFVDEFRHIDREHWPADRNMADLVLADFVLEHVSDPNMFLSEAARVLRTGGNLCIRTVNASSYLGLVSRLVPDRLHRNVLRRIQPDRSKDDVFRTYYRCNTVRRLREALELHGFEAVVYGAEAEPAYLSFNSAAYALGLMYGRHAPSRFRVGLIAWARRR